MREQERARFWWDPAYDDYFDSEDHSNTCLCDDCRERRWLADGVELTQGELLLDDDGDYRVGEGDFESHWFGIQRIEPRGGVL